MDNSAQRLVDVFFYGLYMDAELLAEKGVKVANPRIALLADFRLRLGNKATLLREPGAMSIGMLYAITHADLHRLYWGAGLDAYAAEAVLARVASTSISRYASLRDALEALLQVDELFAEQIPALCCNLIEPPAATETNPEYQEKLRLVMHRLRIPLPDELLC